MTAKATEGAVARAAAAAPPRRLPRGSRCAGRRGGVASSASSASPAEDRDELGPAGAPRRTSPGGRSRRCSSPARVLEAKRRRRKRGTSPVLAVSSTSAGSRSAREKPRRRFGGLPGSGRADLRRWHRKIGAVVVGSGHGLPENGWSKEGGLAPGGGAGWRWARGDSNPQARTSTRPGTERVDQFHHSPRHSCRSGIATLTTGLPIDRAAQGWCASSLEDGHSDFAATSERHMPGGATSGPHIGRGATVVVRRARDLATGATSRSSPYPAEPTPGPRVRAEAGAAERLDYPGPWPCSTGGRTTSSLHLVWEPSWTARPRCRAATCLLDATSVVRIGAEVLSALGHDWGGVGAREKPANILTRTCPAGVPALRLRCRAAVGGGGRALDRLGRGQWLSTALAPEQAGPRE